MATIAVVAAGTTAVVATAAFALVGVLTELVETPGVSVTPVCGVPGVVVVVLVPLIGASGVPGVPVITTPPAATVCAAAVCFANSSIIAIGFSTEGKGDTNNPVAIKVGVGPAWDKDCVQAEIKVVVMTRVTTASDARFL